MTLIARASLIISAGVFALTGVFALIGVAEARTQPIAGAVSLPAGVDLRLPFPAGQRIRVSSGYGPGGGSQLHAGTNRGGSANDYYALDLVYADEDGLGLPVVAPLAGTVVRAGWASAGWANYGQRIYLRHALGDGHSYVTLYAHLNAIADGIEQGAVVEQGQVLGEMGRSCLQALRCGSFNTAHLHWSMHRDSEIGGSGTGGSYGGNAVVPEPMDGVEDLARGAVLVSSNNGRPPVCGDGRCNGEETPDRCPDDCPRCAPVPSEGRVIDEGEICFEAGGDPQYLRRVDDAGWGGGLIWTHAVDGAVDNFGRWALVFDRGGRYRLEAYTDGAYAQSEQARYLIRHGGAEAAQPLDQSAADGWRDLGSYEFAAGADQWVRLNDATGEAFALRRQLVFDAIRLTPIDPVVPDAAVTPSNDAGPAPRPDGGAAPADASSSWPDAAPRADAASPADGGGRPDRGPLVAGDARPALDAALPPPSGDAALMDDTGSDRGCRIGPIVPGQARLLAALLLLLLAKRRSESIEP